MYLSYIMLYAAHVCLIYGPLLCTWQSGITPAWETHKALSHGATSVRVSAACLSCCRGPMHIFSLGVCVRVCLLERLFVAETGWVGYSPKDFQKPLFFNFLCLRQDTRFQRNLQQPWTLWQVALFLLHNAGRTDAGRFIFKLFLPGIPSKHFRVRRRDLRKWNLNETDCTPLSLCWPFRFKYQTF